jgi:hypothetical protein
MLNKSKELNNMRTISTQKLNSYTSEELLNILKQTFMARTLVRKNQNITRKDIANAQKEIVKTLWKKYPEVAKAEGLKKIRVA